MRYSEDYKMGYRDGRADRLIGWKVLSHWNAETEHGRGYRQGQMDALSISYVKIREWEEAEYAL